MKLRALLALLIVAGSASAQDLIGGSSGGATGGGGAPTDATYWLGSANGSLSAEIVVNDIASLEAAISAYDFNDAANLTTGDIAAARMATNWGVAGTSACATSGGVMFDNATAVGCAAGFTFDGTSLSVDDLIVPGGSGFGKTLRITSNTYGSSILFDNAGAGGTIGYNNINDEFKLILTPNSGMQFVVGANSVGAGITDDFGHPTQTNPTLFIHSATRPTVASDEWVSFTHDGTNALFGIGSGAFVFQDPTATTGDTLLKVLSGAGESGNCQEWDDDGTGALASVDCETGNSVFSNVTLGTTGATFYGPSASEPIDCTTSNDGSMYFDTDDQKLCICANDGTDDEWLHSDNYGHLTGHCSI